jgi:outer membrane lipoprotein-sorting protein
MKTRIALFIFLILSLTCSAISVNELRTKLETAYKDISSWQAQLVQTNYFAQIGKTSSFEGNFYYQPPRLLIQFDKPHLQRLHIDGKNVSMYDAQSQTLLKTQLMPQFERMNPIQILQHYWDRSKVEITRQDKNSVTISLSPEKDSFVKQLEATLSIKSGYINELAYTDYSENRVTYKFSGAAANKSIDPKLWIFSPPKGTQIIER